MFYFRITLRYILGTIASLYIITLLFHVFKNGIEIGSGHILAYAIVLVQIPAAILLIIISVYSYLTKKVFWSLFKIEYCFLFATLVPFIISWFVYIVFPYFQSIFK